MTGFDWTSVATAVAAIAGSSATQYLGIRAQRKAQSAQWKQEGIAEQARWDHDALAERERRSREAGEQTLKHGVDLLELLTPTTAFNPDYMSDEIQEKLGPLINSVYLVRDAKVREAVYLALRGMLTTTVTPPPDVQAGASWRECQRLANAMVELVAAWLRGEEFDENYRLLEKAHRLGEERFSALRTQASDSNGSEA